MRPWSSLSGSLAFCGISAAIGKSLPDLRAWQDVARWVQRKLVGQVGFWVCSSKHKSKVCPASNHWTLTLTPRTVCIALHVAGQQTAAKPSPKPKRLSASRRTAIRKRICQSRHMFWRSCPSAENSPCLKDPGLDSGLLLGPFFNLFHCLKQARIAHELGHTSLHPRLCPSNVIYV